ncbi:MAG TPA: VWA domain-containing protein, partial [Terriglobales bacterium]
MIYRVLLGAVVLYFSFAQSAVAQIMSIPTSGFGQFGSTNVLGGSSVMPGLTSVEQMTNNLWAISEGAAHNHSPLENASGSASKLDLKAPGKARKEYSKGYQLLMQKDYKGAVDHLTLALERYPEFVAAHNALGSAYLNLGQNDNARQQFARAIELDDHLPNSYLNLGCAQLALKDYRSAEESVQKASSIAPIDLQLATALSYTQLMNHDYDSVVKTANDVHSRKHEGAAMVHYFAAAAWDNLDNPKQSQIELETLLKEDPKSPAAEQSRQIIAEIKAEAIKKELTVKQRATGTETAADSTERTRVADEQTRARQQFATQEVQEQKQIDEAKAEPMCKTCTSRFTEEKEVALNAAPFSADSFTVRHVVDEVAVFFAATDHGKSVTDLAREDIGILDNAKSPDSITGFRNESELPLRLAIVIDTSESTTRRFAFEQRAATDFLQKILTNKNDSAFVVGVANSVLLVQDFTSDQDRMSHAIDQLTPSGGTALWDAVTFAANKLANVKETQPVAKMLVVISDGEDNSSGATLKQAIEAAERGEVFVYTVSTHDGNANDDPTMTATHTSIGENALKLLADQTGGTSFVPGSITGLNRGLNQLQEVIRSRYLI